MRGLHVLGRTVLQEELDGQLFVQQLSEIVVPRQGAARLEVPFWHC